MRGGLDFILSERLTTVNVFETMQLRAIRTLISRFSTSRHDPSLEQAKAARPGL